MKDRLNKINQDWDFRSNYLIDSLTETEKKQLFKDSYEESFKKGEMVVRRNHVPEYIYFIKKGSVKRFSRDQNGKEYIIQILRENLLFGYHSIMSEERFGTYTETLEDSIIIHIPKQSFLHLLESSHKFQFNLLKILSYEFSIMINYITNYINKPIINRVATQLLLQANYLINFNHIEKTDIQIKIRREDLAALVGASRENIILALSKLKKLQLITSQGSLITIQDVEKLIAFNES
jgi:CRP-like cAMP-binding protein